MKQKQNIIPRNEYGQRHGIWIKYWPNGNVWIKHRYVYGRWRGIYEEYKSNRELTYKLYIVIHVRYSESYDNTNRIRFNI